MRRNCANGVAGSGQVDVDRVLPVRVLPVEDRFEGLDAGVREQDVEPTKGGPRLLGSRAQSGKIALVETRFKPARPSGFDQTTRLRQFLGGRGRNLERRTDRSGNVDAHHVGAFAGEGDRRGAPDPPGGARHDGGLAAQTA
jgi:hypothetical protein